MYAIYELTNPERVTMVVEDSSDIDTTIHGSVLVPTDLESHSPYFSITDGDLYYNPENVRFIRNNLLEDSDWTQLVGNRSTETRRHARTNKITIYK